MSIVAFSTEFDSCPDGIRAIIEEVASESATNAIWFIGSRANDRGTPESDWDILVFGQDEVAPVPARCAGLDVLRVDRSGNSLLEGMSERLIQPFARFGWVRSSKERASYSGQKFFKSEEREGKNQPVELVPCEAILLYEKTG
ncbi:MAG: nucleotidyltransferase domain-containing protein [Verrucomicrobia bacterium]|nr:nucleotidyltransferase domain-containing protein [Verrucomicrobiota bacterium]